MGEAKRRKIGRQSEFKNLEDMFKLHGIRTSEFEFYDQPAFLRQEKISAEYLNNYAKWVALRPRDSAYDAHVRSVVPKLATIIAGALAEDGLKGACQLSTMLMTRMLDQLGVWSFGIQGSASFSVPSDDIWRGLHSVDVPDFPGATLGHSWVCAPPYFVVDPTAKIQQWINDATIVEYIPEVILDLDGKVTKPKVEDVVSAEIRMEYFQERGIDSPTLHYELEPNLRNFGRLFPATELIVGELLCRYVPVAIRQSDEPLNGINTADGAPGRTGQELWTNLVKPAFDLP